jgi:hypothetical protein
MAKVTMAIVVDVPFEKLRKLEDVPEEWRCEYAFNGKRCVNRRAGEEDRFCDLHDRWESTAMAMLGSPLPVDVLSTQVFLGFALNEVMNAKGNRTDAEIQGILSLAKLMAKNSGYL